MGAWASCVTRLPFPIPSPWPSHPNAISFDFRHGFSKHQLRQSCEIELFRVRPQLLLTTLVSFCFFSFRYRSSVLIPSLVCLAVWSGRSNSLERGSSRESRLATHLQVSSGFINESRLGSVARPAVRFHVRFSFIRDRHSALFMASRFKSGVPVQRNY